MSIAPVSQFFILSPRGDTIISKDYRGDAVAGTTDTFFRKASRDTIFVRIFVGGEINILPEGCTEWQQALLRCCTPAAGAPYSSNAVAVATPYCKARGR